MQNELVAIIMARVNLLAHAASDLANALELHARRHAGLSQHGVLHRLATVTRELHIALVGQPFAAVSAELLSAQ